MSIYRSIWMFSSQVPFDRLPSDIRKAMSADDEQAYRDGERYFSRLATKCKLPALKSFFRMLAKNAGGRVHLYAGAKPTFSVYFGFNLRSADRYLQVRLSRGVPLPGDPPPELAEIYSYVSGTIDVEGYSGGWEQAEEIKNVSERRWEPVLLKGCESHKSYPLYDHGNGDYLGYAGAKLGFLYDHEVGRLEKANIVRHANSYFGKYIRHFTGGR